MGWKGTVRSVNSALNEIERDRQRQQRELERRQQQLAKMEELDRAAAEVSLFEEHIQNLVTLHHLDAQDVDWEELARSSEPEFVEPAPEATLRAQEAIDSYSPGRLVTKKRQERKVADLQRALEEARDADERLRKQAIEDHEKEVAEWREQKALAQRIISGDRSAWREASNQIDALASDEFIRFVDLDIPAEGMPTVKFGLQGEDVVPAKQKSLLQSGRVSTKDMPKGRFYEIYQDYVAGALLWVANTVLGLLPIPQVVANGFVYRVDPTTGHLKETLIISGLIPRDTIARLNLERLDPSDGLANFKHSLSFKATKGFAEVEPVEFSG